MNDNSINGFKVVLCEHSGKVTLKSRKKAKQYKIRQERIHGSKFKIYKCKFCQQWHLATIKPKKK